MRAAKDVRWWGATASVTAPLLLITGWTIAARLQPHRYDAIRQTVSALAAHGASDRWVMTLAFLGVAVCNICIGLALRPAAWTG